MGDAQRGRARGDHQIASFRERLWPGALGWSAVAGFAGFVLVALLPVRPTIAVAAAAVALAVGLVVAARTSALVVVSGGELRAGRAHIPVSALGEGRVLDRAGVRAALGPGSDARSYACLRAWIPAALEVRVEDPRDPTPTWLISSRRPTELLAALDAARREAQAAHSEQIG